MQYERWLKGSLINMTLLHDSSRIMLEACRLVSVSIPTGQNLFCACNTGSYREG